MVTAWHIEAIALYLPVLVSGLLIVWLKPRRRIRIGLAMTCGWQAATLPWLNLWAQDLGYWSFQSENTSLFGIPLSLYLGWVILWGIIVPLVAGRLPIRQPMIVTCLAAIILDLATMPLMKPVLILGPEWIIGEIGLVSFALIPSLLLAHFTFLDQKPKLRALLISISFTLLTLGVLPFVTQNNLPAIITQLREAHATSVHFLVFAVVTLLGVPAMAAVREFATVGRGTPIPFDPPKTLVTTGIYAYLANPMQSSLVVTLLAWSAYLNSGIALILAVAGFLYSVGFARWSEATDLEQKHGESWLDYRKKTRAWIPRLLPLRQVEPSQIYFDFQCGPCCEIATWFQKREIPDLEIQNADRFPGPSLKRVTYRYPDGTSVQGVEAVAAALSHIHLGWAWLSWLIRLPIVLPLAEIAFGHVFKTPSSCALDSHRTGGGHF